MKFILSFVLLFSIVLATPPARIPEQLRDEFTMGGKIPIANWYRDDSYSSDKPIIFTKAEIDDLIRMADSRQSHYYGATDDYLFAAFDTFQDAIKNKNVAVIGTIIPWYESILLSYGAHPTTIEYNKIISEDPRIKVMTVQEYSEQPKKFDALVSISSIEHDGLGRYGDPINPNGDLETMRKAKEMLNPGGLLFLAVPVGSDYLVWNVHRVYGELRLRELLKDWRIIGHFGFSESDFERDGALHYFHQPVFVLQPL